MSEKERGTRKDEGEGEKREAAPQGGLGILFLAAGMGLALVLSLVGLIAYFAMSH